MIYQNDQMSLIQCGDIVRGIEMVGDVVVIIGFHFLID